MPLCSRETGEMTGDFTASAKDEEAHVGVCKTKSCERSLSQE